MLFDLSEKSIETLKGMLGKCLEGIHSRHMDWSLTNHQMTVFENLVWSVKDGYIRMEANEIDAEHDYYSFTIKYQELPDPLPYEINEVGQLCFNSISSVHIWSHISHITLLSFANLKPGDPSYDAIIFHLENGRIIGVTPNFPWGFNLYFDRSAWKLFEGSVEQLRITNDDFKSTLSEERLLAAGARALWGQIPRNLRAVTISFDKQENKCEWISIFDREPKEDELESQRQAATYLFVDIDEGNVTFSENYIVKAELEPIDTVDSILLFHRYEEGFMPPTVRPKKVIRFGEINSSGMESLIGLVTKNLEAVSIDFSRSDLELTWYPIFLNPPDDQEIKFQQLAAERFLSSFGVNKQPKVIPIVGDNCYLPDTQIIFERLKGNEPYEKGKSMLDM